MCEAFRQMKEKYTKIGREEGIISLITAFKELEIAREIAWTKVKEKYHLSEDEVDMYLDEYWK